MKKTSIIYLLASFVYLTSTHSQTLYVPNGTSGIGNSTNSFLGIGTASPKGFLDIKNGDVSYGGNNKVQIALSYYHSSGQYSHWIRTRHNNVAGGINNAIDFYTCDGTSNGTFPANAVHGLTINNGKIGIGTASPSSNYKLHVVGNLNIDGTIYNNGVPLGNHWTESNGNVFRLSGMVSIGDPTPTSKLSIVTDGTNLPTSNRTIADITVNNTTSGQEFTGLKIHTTSVGSVDITGLSVFVDNTSVGSDGNLIGGYFDVLPHEDLEYGQSIGIWSKGTLGIRADGIQTGVYGYSQTGTAIKGYSSTGYAGLFYGKTYFDSKVGIGTTDMTDAKLTIYETSDIEYGEVTALKVIASSTAPDPSDIIAGDFDASIWSEGASIGVKTIGYHYGIQASSIDGIGVYGYSTNGHGVKGISSSNNSSSAGVWGYSSKGFGIRGESPSGYAGYFIGKSYFSTNVNIGTTASTAYLLNVNGDILCEKVQVIEDVPSSDFVFEKDYSLMNLYELEHYIQKNKHLPEIPSAQEFKENGYSLGTMDDLLLRKVEEITLYVIELKKENEAQQKLIEEQNKKIEELQKTR